MSTLLLTSGACGSIDEDKIGGGGDGGGLSITLMWDAPEKNTDDSPLTDLAGYKLYIGTSSNVYTTTINVGSVTTYTISGLSSGTTYYASVRAYDNSNNLSGYSDEAFKTL